MDVVSGDRLVSEYLGRLHAAAWVLPAARRTALVDRTRRRLHDDLGDAPEAAPTRVALDRLGAPEELVRAESVDAGPAPVTAPPVPSVWGSLEVAAVLLLAVGGLALPVVGPAVGLVLAWLSDRWTSAQRLVATVLAVVPLVLLAVLSALLGGTWGAVVLVALLVPLAGLVPAAYLGLALRRRAGAPPGHGPAARG